MSQLNEFILTLSFKGAREQIFLIKMPTLIK